MQYDNANVPKQKGKGPIIGLIAALVIVVVAGVTAFAARDKIANMLKKNTASPVDYYHTVEKDNLNESLDSSIKLYDEQIGVVKSGKFTSNVNAKFELGDGLYALLTNDYFDFKQIKSLELLMTTSINDSAMGFNLASKMNDTGLISANCHMDMKNSELFFQIPEIREGYVDASSALNGIPSENYIKDFDFSKLFKIYPEGAEFKKCLTTYTNLIIDSFKNVTKENVTLTSNSVEQKCTALNATMSGTELYELSNELLDTLKEDTVIINIIDGFKEYAASLDASVDLSDFSVEAYVEAIDSLKSGLESSKSDIEACDELLKMTVYVDNDGKIIGRDITLSDNSDTVKLVSKQSVANGKFGYEANVSYNDESYLICRGSGEYNLSDLSGTYSFSLPTEDISFSAKISNCNTIDIMKGTFKGDITLSTEMDILKDYVLKLSIDSTKDSQLVSCNLFYNNTSYGKLTLTSSTSDKATSFKPDDSDEVIKATDENAITEYYSDFDVKKFYNDFVSEAGIDFDYEQFSLLFSSLIPALTGSMF